jgi:lipoprotein-releasing system permease protein
MYKWFLAWRYLHTKLIAFFGIASVMLCVAMVLVVMSVMGGFLDTIRARSRGLHSEIVLEGGTLQGFPYYEEFTRYLSEKHADVVSLCTPALYTYGIFRVPATTLTKPARVLGVQLDEYVRVNDFKEGLQYERFYPGTTSLDEQEMPVAGVSEQTGSFRLPSELERANTKWREAQRDPEEVAAYRAVPFETSPFPYVTSAFSGDRVYAAVIGEPTYEGPAFPGIIVGCDMLHERDKDGSFRRYIARGTQMALTVMPLTQSGNVTGEPPIRLPLRYADDSRTGIYEIDSLCVYVDFDMLQHKLAMDAQPTIEGGTTRPRTNQLLVGLQDGVELNEAWAVVAGAWTAFRGSLGVDVAADDARLLDFVEVYTWEDLQRPFIAAVEKEKVLVTFLFGLISIVAIVLVGCIFYMIVEKKTRDIGVLKSLGASPRGVATVFIAYAGAVGVAGAILGTIVGCLFVWNINAIQDFLASLNPALRVWSADVYSFDRIPEVVKQSDAVWIAVIAVLSSMVGSLIPAALAGRVWPVQALRYE